MKLKILLLQFNYLLIELREKYLDKVGDDNKNFSGYLSTITKQIKDIEHLVNEFSDFARMPKPVLKKVNLNQIIPELCSYT